MICAHESRATIYYFVRVSAKSTSGSVPPVEESQRRAYMPIPDQKHTRIFDSLIQRDEIEWRPTFFRLSEEPDRVRLQSLVRTGPSRPRIFDSLLTQVR